MNLFDYAASAAARDTAISAVMAGQTSDWRSAYRSEVALLKTSLQTGTTFLGEDLRFWLQPIIGEPEHPNAWGAMARSTLSQWKREGFIIMDGIGASRSVKSHACLSPRYRVIG